MLFNKSKINKGFTLIEILVVLAIFAAIFTISVYFFGGLTKKEALEKDTASLKALIRNARLLSTASKDAMPFGLHLEDDKAVLFEGSSYAAGGSNEKVTTFSRYVHLYSYSLNGGGPDIIFSRLTGDTPNYGDITLSLKDDSASTTITVLKTGVIQ